ncbi:MAG: MFS transporter [Acidimicrobiales bacterium]
MLIGSQVLIATAAMGMGLAVVTGRETFWMLLLAAVAQGSAFGFFGPARTAFTRDLVGREQLGNAISLSMLSMNGTRIFAPSIAGALAGVAFIGIGKTYLIAGAFSVISLLAMLRLPNIAPAASTKRNPFLDIADGVRYVAARPPLRRLVLSSLFVIMFAFNYVAFMPALIEGEFGLGEGSVGLMSTASAIGAVAAFAPVARRADSPVARLMMICSGFGFGIGVMLLGLAPNLAVAMLITAGIGVMTSDNVPVAVEHPGLGDVRRNAPGAGPVAHAAVVCRLRYGRCAARHSRRSHRPPTDPRRHGVGGCRLDGGLCAP